jgi:hypothetical protein
MRGARRFSTPELAGDRMDQQRFDTLGRLQEKPTEPRQTSRSALPKNGHSSEPPSGRRPRPVTLPTRAKIPEAGQARYFRYLMRRIVERPQLMLDGAMAIASPRVTYLDLAGGPSRSVLILGSQRSGSTLLGEVLVHHDRQRFMFEPFWSAAVGESRHFARGRYEDPESDNPELDRLLETLLSGTIRNLHVDRFNTSRFPRGRVIKDIFATNLAPYVAAHLPEVPLIFLLRHPVAAAHSAVALGWEDDLETILQQGDLITGQFAAQVPLIESVVARERHTIVSFALRWCLENYLPLLMLRRASTHVVLFEDLVQSGESELDRLAAFLRRRSPALWSSWRPDPALLLRPSASSRPRDEGWPSQEQLRSGWRDEIAPAQLERSLEILQAFGLDRLFGAGPDPLVGVDEVLIKP